jgi:hypothetical protein
MANKKKAPKKPSGPSKSYQAHRDAGERRLVAWLPEGLVDAIEAEAKREGVSVTMLVGTVLMAHVVRSGLKAKAAR